MIFYYGTQLSPHMDKTPEGYLICRDVPIARTGTQEYLARELQLDGDPERPVTVNRYPEDVFAPAALASFEGKDVTAGHPPENVGPENFASYSKGHVQNVRRSGEYIIADLILKDAGLVSDVWNGVTREVSCGYLCEYVPDGSGYKQQNIRGNHVAVVPRGRAGHEVAIKDQAASEAGKGKKRMKKETKEALYRFFGLAAQDAEPEELEKLTSAEHAEKEAAVTIPADERADMAPAAKDAAVALLRKVRPAVAAIKDEKERSRVVDALLSTIQGPNVMGQVMEAAAANARKAADAAQSGTFEERCRASEAAYAARNPHKKKED